MRSKLRSQVIEPGGAGSPPLDGAYPDSIADRVARLNVLLKRQMGSFAKQRFDLTVIETRLVILLGIAAPTNVGELTARSDMDRTQISRSIVELARRGLVSRTEGATDRRETMVALTRAGRAVHDRIIAHLYKHNEALVAGLPPGSLRLFLSVMDQLIARADALQNGSDI